MRGSKSWLIWAMLLAVVAAAPARGDERAPADPSDGQSALNRQLNEEIHALQGRVEEALVWRLQAAEYLRYVEAKPRNESLSSADLAELYARAERYLALRERLFVHVRRHEHLYAALLLPYRASRPCSRPARRPETTRPFRSPGRRVCKSPVCNRS